MIVAIRIFFNGRLLYRRRKQYPAHGNDDECKQDDESAEQSDSRDLADVARLPHPRNEYSVIEQPGKEQPDNAGERLGKADQGRVEIIDKVAALGPQAGSTTLPLMTGRPSLRPTMYLGGLPSISRCKSP
jgi:hypothetical protein